MARRLTVKAFLVAMCVVVCVSAGLLRGAVGYDEKVLESFEGANALGSWQSSERMSVVAEHATEGRKALTVTLKKMGSNVGATGLRWDLTGCRKLRFDITSSGPPAIITLKASDTAGNSYTSWYYLVQPGYNRVEYNVDGLASALDVSSIASVNIRIDAKIPGPVTFSIDNIRVSRGPDDDSWLIPEELPEPAVEVPGNLVENGSFELGLENWGSWGQWDGGTYTFGSGSGDDAHSGGASAAIICQTKGRGGINAVFKAPVAGTYNATVYAKGKDGAVFRTAAPGSEVAGVGDERTTGRWQQFKYTIKVAEAGQSVRLYLFNVGTGVLYLDDVVVLPPGGAAARREQEGAVTRKSAAVSIEGDVMTVDGKPFFPIGIYGASNPKTDLAGTGFNLVTGGATSSSGAAYLDACAEAGLYSWVNFTGLARGHVPWQAGGMAAKVMDHPAVIGWYLCDEPDHQGWNVPPPELRVARDSIAKVDKGAHPAISLVMAWAPSNIYQYADTCEILSSDPYCINKTRPCNLHYVSRCVDTMRDAVHDDRPVWVVLQAGWDVTEEPTREEQYAQTYLAVTHGADGILWFELRYAKSRPDVWKAVKDLADELKALTPALTARTVWIKKGLGHPAINAILKETDEAYYLIAVNVPETSGHGEPLPSKDLKAVQMDVKEVASAGSAEVWFEGRTAVVGNGSITDDFRLYERHVYEIRK